VADALRGDLADAQLAAGADPMLHGHEGVLIARAQLLVALQEPRIDRRCSRGPFLLQPLQLRRVSSELSIDLRDVLLDLRFPSEELLLSRADEGGLALPLG
jgi:hypothetical protein